MPHCRMFIALMATTCITILSSYAQPDTHPDQGLRDNPPDVHAFINATIVTEPGESIKNGTLVIRGSVIEAIGANIEPPADARVWDCDGLTIYPGLIESHSNLGLNDDYSDPPAPRYWNQRIRPERSALDLFDPGADAGSLRELGFVAAMLAPQEGILRGEGGLVSLAEGGFETRVLNPSTAQSLGWDRGGYQDYPTSQMGVIALLRQSFFDAQWYADAWRAYQRNPKQDAPETNHSLDALQATLDGELPLLVDAFNEHRYWQAQELIDEFNLDMIALGSGYEYRQLDTFTESDEPLILPLNFPDKPDFKTWEETLDVSLTALRHWERAPSNPAILDEAGVDFILTSARLDNAGDLPGKIREAIKRGLNRETMLAAFTTRPAALWGVDDALGTIEPGKRASFVVIDGELFGEDSTVHHTWVDGQPFIHHRPAVVEAAGLWDFTLPHPGAQAFSATMEITGDAPKVSGAITYGASEFKFTFSELDRRRLSFSLDGEGFGHEGVIQFSGIVEDDGIEGYGAMPDGSPFEWNATKRNDDSEDEQSDNEDDSGDEGNDEWTPISRLVYPPVAYGYEEPPEEYKHVFVHNATIWTSGPKGILKNADLLVRDGKVVDVGLDLTPPRDAFIIDAEGKHVTPGLIDPHSHTAIDTGVNEVGQEITAEVRIGDVIDSYDINLYRQLAGGITMIHPLHGSANAIGGQCAQLKLRWGGLPSELKYENAFPTIKFALGENPKRVWRNQYPRTRMGVEQIIRDRFLAAKDYMALREGAGGGIAPPRDLELDALVEILNDERLIHCHSYRQDEILMLMRLGEELGFRVGTFQHILEGYKVAEVMAEHGAAGSSFTDWWAYKFEVFDAIPYNAALMHRQGVNVSFNSDSAELARRMNTEAAKAVKYGGVPEEEALKFVTLNPAIQMGIDEYVGSLEPGKDADFVIWSGHPLSAYSICEQTWVDGINYFNRADDMAMREAVETERAELIQLILTGGESAKGKSKDEMSEDERRFWFKENVHAQGCYHCCLHDVNFLEVFKAQTLFGGQD